MHGTDSDRCYTCWTDSVPCRWVQVRYYDSICRRWAWYAPEWLCGDCRRVELQGQFRYAR